MKDAEAAASAAIARGDSDHDVAQAAGNAVKAAGGTQADIIKAVANATVVAHTKKTRDEMTDAIFEAWDLNNNRMLEFEEILPKYMTGANHTGQVEAKVRAGFERFMQNQGKKPSESMDREVFGKWMGRATIQQVTSQFLKLKHNEDEEKAIIDLAVQAAKATGATDEEVAKAASHVAVAFGKSKEEADAAAAAEAKKAAAKKKAEEEEAKRLEAEAAAAAEAKKAAAKKKAEEEEAKRLEADAAAAAEAKKAAKKRKAEEEEAKSSEADAAAAAEAKKAAAKKTAEEEAKKAAAKKNAEEEEAKSLKLQEKYESIFDKIDVGKKGVLSSKDLGTYFSRMDAAARSELGVTKIDDFMKEADLDGDGQIERDEFALYFTYVNLEKETCYNAIFDAIDFDGDGQLTMEEVRDFDSEESADLFRLLAIPNWHSMVSKMDKDGDGQISREEFMSYMMGRLDKAAEAKVEIPQKPAWKQAAKMPGKRKQGDDLNKCWDFAKGYCYRGARCRYEHAEEDKVDQSVLDEHLKACREVANAAGVHLNKMAMNELQTLTVCDATKLINSLGFGGEHEGILDKNNFVIHKARQFRMQAVSKDHPDWNWYHGSNKRQRIA